MKRQLIGVGIACLLGLGSSFPAPAQATVETGSQVASRAPAAISPLIAGWTSDLVGNGAVRRFVVPTLDCRQAQRQGIGVGVGRQTDATVPEIIAEVLLRCDDNEPQYLIEVFVDGAGAQSVVSAGDVLRFKISYAAGTATASATVIGDPVASLTMTGSATPAALHFGAFPFAVGSALQDVPDFGVVRLIEARSAGAPLSEGTATRVRRVEGGEVKISASGISDRPSTAGSFRLRFENH